MSSKTNNWGAGLWLPRSLKQISAQADTIKAKQAKAPQRMRQLLARRGKAIAEKRTKDYLTTSNDNTQVKYSQAPQKQYNPYLTERGVQGAKSNAIWEKEHPNTAAWEYAASAIPFAVAAAPAVMAGSNALAGTALGRLGAQLLAKPAVQYINEALTAAMVGHGASEVAHGNFTPMTALELTPAGKTIADAGKMGYKAAENYLLGKYLASSTNQARLKAVNSAFRDLEWQNFLAARNGDAYYRMPKNGQQTFNRNPREKFFVSHTTPWEEFTGVNSFATDGSVMLLPDIPFGITHLYEFPTETFGRLKSTNYNGLPTDYDVAELGRKHLLYGNTSSRKIGPVRRLSDEDAAKLGMSPFTMGHTERPLLRGHYDTSPVYDDILMGNQTTIDGAALNNAVSNTTYNLFKRTPAGVLHIIHTGKQYQPAAIRWEDAQRDAAYNAALLSGD